MYEAEKDRSYGWDAVADEFMALRSNMGAEIVRAWAGSLPKAGSVLDIGCGHGEPLARILTQEGFEVFALDASPRMVAAFEKRFPGVPVACEPAEESAFFGRSFDGALAVGLLFLLDEETQRRLIGKMAGALRPGGSLLFSAPRETGAWTDLQTGRRSVSLGEETYRRLIESAGLELRGMPRDDGGNQYWEANFSTSAS